MSKNALLRVTQMNAGFFDNEIYKIFGEHVQEILTYLPPGFSAKFQNELNLILRLIIFNYSILTSDSTFGQKLMSVKYDNLTKLKRGLYIVPSFLEYFKEKFEGKIENAVLKDYLNKFIALIQIFRFLNVSIFLRSGIRPLLIDRLLFLDQSYLKDHNQRIYDTQFMTRELLWDSFIELLVYILPLINYHKLKRTVKYLNPFHKKQKHFDIESRNYTVDTKCPHCEEYPILPSHMGCAHVFCYTCLKGNQLADNQYECPICEYSSYNSMCDRITSV
ncbi:peroxisome biogenesis factor 2 [Onthophagus taurus]|uniref:peroxisome biogenesis factor 2 n=1 Tax=Onthophagus taurus TaxID=166361 RepID=UPI000C20D310|nr:peroxisome biogenesis factor 2 [Onthophagus taurus]